jgi:hypothetical protein
MNIVETVMVQAHNACVARGRAVTQVLKNHVGRRFQDTIVDGWTKTLFNLTGKHYYTAHINDNIIELKLELWSHGKFVNQKTKRVVLDDASVEEAAPVDWSTKTAGSDQTYTITVTIQNFPDDPEEFIKRVQESASLTNPGDSVRWHDVLGRTIKGVSKDSKHEVFLADPMAVAKTMFIGEVFSQDVIEEKVERAFVIDDYTWTYYK